MRALQFLRWLREEEGAPIGVAADDATLAEDYGAGGFCDLFDFGEAAWSDLHSTLASKQSVSG